MYACNLKNKEPIVNILLWKLGSVTSVSYLYLVVEQVSEAAEIVRRDGADGQQVRHLSWKGQSHEKNTIYLSSFSKPFPTVLLNVIIIITFPPSPPKKHKFCRFLKVFSPSCWIFCDFDVVTVVSPSFALWFFYFEILYLFLLTLWDNLCINWDCHQVFKLHERSFHPPCGRNFQVLTSSVCHLQWGRRGGIAFFYPCGGRCTIKNSWNPKVYRNSLLLLRRKSCSV